MVAKWDQVDRWVKKNTVMMLEKVKGKNISLEQLMSGMAEQHSTYFPDSVFRTDELIKEFR